MLEIERLNTERELKSVGYLRGDCSMDLL